MTTSRLPSLLAPLAFAALLSACATGPNAPLRIDSSHPSQNEDSRALYLVLHYTVLDQAKSLKVLTTGGQVSSHYLVGDDNPVTVFRLVDENRRAWHAGSSYWGGNTNLNSASIGIEIVNPGYTDTPTGRVYAPFQQRQIDALIKLVRDIATRQGIKPERIIGHADIAPGRKQDPGPMFPWKQLADAGLIPWPDFTQVDAKIPAYVLQLPDTAWVQDKLARIGYYTSRNGEMDKATTDALLTFQMKYRPTRFDGQLDPETAALLDVVTTPGGMLMAKSAPNNTVR